MHMKEPMVEIKDLYVNFYTQNGVVKALDGVNLTIYKGETLGLVGETGCGKSVTANTIIRLIPQPPGKIERGNIYFMKPDATQEKKDEIVKNMNEISSAKGEGADNDPVYKGYKTELAEIGRILELRSKIRDMETEGVKSGDPPLAALNQEMDKITNRYDFLTKSKGYMQKIRGKYISMIFQEPMSALNPVMRVGNQIAEGLLLHEQLSLSQGAYRDLQQELVDLKRYKHVKVKRNQKKEPLCGNCGAIVQEGANKCPDCDGSFASKPFRHLSAVKTRYYLSIYKGIIKNPDGRRYKILSKVPVVRRYQKPMKKEAMDRSVRMLRLVRIPDPEIVVNNYPFELSGGMQQRVMIAMALACKPQLLIADEPTTALDVTIQAQILKLMNELQEETGTSILFITHNLGVVAEMCDRVGVMYAGSIVEIGDKNSLFKEPLHPYTQGLMNSIPRVNLDLPRLETIEGNVPNLVKPPSGCRFHPRCPYAMDVCRSIKPENVEIRKDHFAACHLYTGVKF
jgi:peptide/nickel transport system ATP-binding protein